MQSHAFIPDENPTRIDHAGFYRRWLSMIDDMDYLQSFVSRVAGTNEEVWVPLWREAGKRYEDEGDRLESEGDIMSAWDPSTIHTEKTSKWNQRIQNDMMSNSYESERKPHVTEVIKKAIKIGDEIKKITELLTKNFSSKIKLNYKHDESLIGGLVVQVGSTMVDTSIKNKLQQIENRMIEA